jgi:FkbM family methyltransferase
MGEHTFERYGVQFKFDDNENSTVPSFGWYMGVLSNGIWETDTFEIFDKVKDKNKIAIDIGGWIGSTSIWLSKHFEKVIVVEADKNALVAMKNNLIRNDCNNVDVVEKALYNQSSNEVIFGHNQHANSSLGDSMSQTKEVSNSIQDYKVETITLESLISDYPKDKISFLKIDIEGGEEKIFEDLVDLGNLYGWKVWLSFHYGWWEDKNIHRFEQKLSKINKVFFNNNEIKKDEFFSYVLNHHLGTFYIEF